MHYHYGWISHGISMMCGSKQWTIGFDFVRSGKRKNEKNWIKSNTILTSARTPEIKSLKLSLSKTFSLSLSIVQRRTERPLRREEHWLTNPRGGKKKEAWVYTCTKFGAKIKSRFFISFWFLLLFFWSFRVLEVAIMGELVHFLSGSFSFILTCCSLQLL